MGRARHQGHVGCGHLRLIALESAGYVYKSDFALRNQAIGKARAEAYGMAKMLLVVLEGRDVRISAEVREQILGCADEGQLEIWGRRAATANTVVDLFD